MEMAKSFQKVEANLFNIVLSLTELAPQLFTAESPISYIHLRLYEIFVDTQVTSILSSIYDKF